MSSEETKRILFVCLGNICRSPAAEGVMQHLIDQRGLGNQIAVDSAGTSSYHIGEPADKRMRAAAGQRGIELTSRARMVNQNDFSDFEMIIAMDRDNFRELHALKQNADGQVRLLSDFLDDSWPVDVPDPYYGGDEGFDEVLDLLQAACPKLLDQLYGP